MLSTLQQQLLNQFQQDFPLSARPFYDIAVSLGVTEQEILSVFAELNEQQLINRIGAIISPNHIGVSSLVAMAVPAEQLDSVAETVSQYPQVNHNYERENRLNLWFVLIARDDEELHTVLNCIEQQVGYKTMRLPLLADYYINLGFELDFND